MSELLKAQRALKAIQNADITRQKEVDPEGFKRREAELLNAQMEGRRRQQEAAEALAMRDKLEQALQETRFRKAGQALLAALIGAGVLEVIDEDPEPRQLNR
tara:strand:+ start:207 stop:512 length:306 start_codon:yes stop_codon:yes gene_type:complete